MKIRRKTNRCLNCGHTLGEIYNFCPHCGQENNDIDVSFSTFVGEFFANYLSFDSRIGRSIGPFFLQPGFLTNRFNEGKRMRYVHPLRLYLIVSVFFFFVATLWVQENLDNVSASEREVLNVIETETEDDSLPRATTWSILLPLMRNATLSDQEVLDSLKSIGIIENASININGVDSSTVAHTLLHQVRRVASNDLSIFGGFIMQNLPIMMFIVLPLLALVIKLFYVRRKFRYLHHLVHVLHLHAFAFLLYSVYLLIIILFDSTSTVPDWINEALLVVMIIYSFLSLLRVYQQSWYKTLLKLFLLGNIYFMLITLAGVIEALISFLIF